MTRLKCSAHLAHNVGLDDEYNVHEVYAATIPSYVESRKT